jgi:hypothetical protein
MGEGRIMTGEEWLDKVSKLGAYGLASLEYNECLDIIGEAVHIIWKAESRTCENCKHTTFDFNSDYSICEKGIGWYWNSRVECSKDFGCNKWESKDD